MFQAKIRVRIQCDHRTASEDQKTQCQSAVCVKVVTEQVDRYLLDDEEQDMRAWLEENGWFHDPAVGLTLCPVHYLKRDMDRLAEKLLEVEQQLAATVK